jgi:predicted amidohydrolase
VQLTEWGDKDNPYYEKAMILRAMENTIFFASVGYAMRYPESATSLIGPDGTCIAHEAYGKAGIVVVEIDPTLATGMLAKRFKPHLY